MEIRKTRCQEKTGSYQQTTVNSICFQSSDLAETWAGHPRSRVQERNASFKCWQNPFLIRQQILLLQFHVAIGGGGGGGGSCRGGLAGTSSRGAAAPWQDCAESYSRTSLWFYIDKAILQLCGQLEWSEISKLKLVGFKSSSQKWKSITGDHGTVSVLHNGAGESLKF